ncbi:MAG: pseudouridine synthase [Promethearchaeota archaeon]|nr:MAG: pseudouridine synthase [Candidatus Lokiarchaeota archaeon]
MIDSISALRKVKAISDYQFGPLITDVVFKEENNIQIERSKNTNKIRYIYLNQKLIFSLRPTNGLLTLSLYSAQIIIEAIPSPKLRVIVQNDIQEFIKKGRSVFCKHVVYIDEDLRPNDEVIVVNEDDELLGIGRLKLPIPYIKSFNSGIAVNIRKGVYK